MKILPWILTGAVLQWVAMLTWMACWAPRLCVLLCSAAVLIGFGFWIVLAGKGEH